MKKTVPTQWLRRSFELSVNVTFNVDIPVKPVTTIPSASKVTFVPLCSIENSVLTAFAEAIEVLGKNVYFA